MRCCCCWWWWFLCALLWTSSPGSQGSPGVGEQLSRQEVLSWFRLKVLDGLGVEEPPVGNEKRPPGGSVPERRRRTERVDHRHHHLHHHHGETRRETTQMILFPTSEPSCAKSDPGQSSTPHLTYFFQPSINPRDSVVTSAQLWFYSGLGVPVNSSRAPLSMLPSGDQQQQQQPLLLLQASPAPSHQSQDGWSTYDLNQNALRSMGEGPFWLQVQCVECTCHSEPDKTPFLNLMVQSPGTKRKPRSVSIPWSPSVLDLLQRPSPERHGDCHRAHIEISFDELGWDNWIVHPKSLTFYYCHGNCSSPDRATVGLGMTQCCAPVPGSMKSLRITTTSDGGYSFKYETLPNIIPEECACI